MRFISYGDCAWFCMFSLLCAACVACAILCVAGAVHCIPCTMHCFDSAIHCHPQTWWWVCGHSSGRGYCQRACGVCPGNPNWLSLHSLDVKLQGMRRDINDFCHDQQPDAHPAIARVRSCGTRESDQNIHRNLIALLCSLGFANLLEAIPGQVSHIVLPSTMLVWLSRDNLLKFKQCMGADPSRLRQF